MFITDNQLNKLLSTNEMVCKKASVDKLLKACHLKIHIPVEREVLHASAYFAIDELHCH